MSEAKSERYSATVSRLSPEGERWSEGWEVALGGVSIHNSGALTLASPEKTIVAVAYAPGQWERVLVRRVDEPSE